MDGGLSHGENSGSPQAVAMEYGDFIIRRSRAGYKGQRRKWLADPTNRRNVINKVKASIAELQAEIDENKAYIQYLEEYAALLGQGEIIV